MNYKPQKKVLWYLHPYAGGPGIGQAFRPYYFCREFALKNITPVIVSSSWHHLMYNKSTHQENQEIDNINYFFLKNKSYSSNGIGRILNMFSYSIKLLTNKKIKVKYPPDIIIVSSPHLFTFLSAYIISKRYKSKLILEVRDLWPLSLVDIAGVSKSHPIVTILSMIEKFAYKKSDYIVTLFNNGKKYFSNFKTKDNSIVYIPNGSIINNNPKNISDDNIVKYIKKKKAIGEFIIGYTGAHGTPNALGQLLRATLILKNKKINNYHIIMIGDGIEKDRLIEFSNKNNLDNITFFDSVNKDRIETIINEFDLCYIASLKKDIYQYGVSPNKLFEYMGASKPILSSIYLDSIIEDAKCGIVADSEDEQDLALKIDFFLNIDSNKLKIMGENGSKYLLKNHNIKKLANNYLELFQ